MRLPGTRRQPPDLVQDIVQIRQMAFDMMRRHNMVAYSEVPTNTGEEFAQRVVTDANLAIAAIRDQKRRAIQEAD